MLHKELNLGPMKETGAIIQLASHSSTYSKGMVENILLQVDSLIFFADFYVMDMNDDDSCHPSLILLGRQFLSTML